MYKIILYDKELFYLKCFLKKYWFEWFFIIIDNNGLFGNM